MHGPIWRCVLVLLIFLWPACNRVGFFPLIDPTRDAGMLDGDGGGDAGVVAGDDGTADAGEEECLTYYLDSDGDGLGDVNNQLTACRPQDGYVANSDDCDDSSALCGPECLDTDLDSLWDCRDDCLDRDGDGYGIDGPAGVCLGADCDDDDPVWCLVPGEGCDLSAGLLAYWSFDEGSGSQAADHSAFGHHGQLRADSAWVPGVIGQAVKFDGVDDYIVLDHTDGFGFGGGMGSFSLAYWINPAEYDHTPMPRPFELAYCPNNAYLFAQLYTDGHISFGGYTNDPEWAETHSLAGSVPLDSWTHVVHVVDRVSMTGQTYINGQPSGEPTDMSRWADGIIDCSGNPTIRVIGGYPGFLFSGSLDEMRIYGMVLGQEEVSDLYQNRCPCCQW